LHRAAAIAPELKMVMVKSVNETTKCARRKWVVRVIVNSVRVVKMVQ